MYQKAQSLVSAAFLINILYDSPGLVYERVCEYVSSQCTLFSLIPDVLRAELLHKDTQ